MCASEHWNIHWDAKRIWFVQTDSEIPLPTQQQQNEHTDVHETNTGYQQTQHLKWQLGIHLMCKTNTQSFGSSSNHACTEYLHWSALASFRQQRIGTRTSSTSLLFRTKNKNFQDNGKTGKEIRGVGGGGVKKSLWHQAWAPTLLKSQNFQKRTRSSWWNWIFLVELGRQV